MRRDRWGHGTAVWIIAIVVLTLPPIFWSIGRIEMHNDVAGWLPQDDPQAKILAWYRSSFPTEDRILVSWDDCTITDPRLKLVRNHLEGRLRGDGTREGGSSYVSSVSLPSGLLQRMLDRNIPFATALDRINGLLCGRGPLRIRLTDVGRRLGDELSADILATLEDMSLVDARFVDSKLLPPSADEVPDEDTSAGKLNDALTMWVRDQPAFDLAVTWPQMHSDPAGQQQAIEALKNLAAGDADVHGSHEPCVEDVFFIDGSQAALTVTLSETGVAEREASLAVVREACLQAGVSEDDLRLGGRPVVSAELNKAVARAGWNRSYELWDFPHRSPVLFSMSVSILLSLWMLKSLRLAVLVQVVAVVTVLASIAIVPVTGGSMNMVLVVMPTLLAVLTTSAAIHLANYWKHSAVRDEEASVIQAASTAWLPCCLASGTTAIGLGSLLVSNLIPVKDFGIYSALGCIISFFMVLYLLPSLMLYWRRLPPEAAELNTHAWNTLGLWLSRLRYPAVILCVLITVVCGYGLIHFRTETKVIRYFPPDSRLYQDYVFLEDNLSGIISVDTIVRFSKEARINSKDRKKSRSDVQGQMTFMDRARTVMALQSKIREHKEISGTLSLASFLDLRDRSQLSFAQFQAQNRTEDAITEKLENPDQESEDIASLLSLPETATPGPAPGEPELNAAGDELWRISAQASILSDLDLEILTAELDEIASSHLANVTVTNRKREEVNVNGVGHVVTGLIPVFLRTQQAVLESLINSFGMAFALIAIVMMILFRSLRAGLITMLPNLMPVIIVFGALSWARLRVDIGTMITASVALGIAVDGTLHLITWFQELLKQGKTIPESVAGALSHCGPAMLQTSAIIGLGMVALLPAELLLISRFGWMLAALIFAALVADIVLLPALLAGPLGTLIQRSIVRQQGMKAAPQEEVLGAVSNQPAAAMSSLADGSRLGLNRSSD
ncbi:MAG: MMPL family transporter [Planctomycetaceae bacterium]